MNLKSIFIASSAVVFLVQAAVAAEKFDCSQSKISISIAPPFTFDNCHYEDKGKSSTHPWDGQTRAVWSKKEGNYFKVLDRVGLNGVIFTYGTLDNLKSVSKSFNSWIRKHAEQWKDPQDILGGHVIQLKGDDGKTEGTCFVYRWYGGMLSVNGANRYRIINYCKDDREEFFSEKEISEILNEVSFSEGLKKLNTTVPSNGYVENKISIDEVEGKLSRLKKLFDRNLITKSDYDREKKIILDEMR